MEENINVTVIVTNINEIKQLTNEIETQVQGLKENIKKLNEMGLQFEVKTNK